MQSRNKQSKTTFLFVNKTQKSKSLSRSDGDDARQINRHAQQMRSRRKEAIRITSIRESSLIARRIALSGYSRVFQGHRQDPVHSTDVSPDSSSSSSTSSPPREEYRENTLAPVRIAPDSPEAYSNYYSLPIFEPQTPKTLDETSPDKLFSIGRHAEDLQLSLPTPPASLHLSNSLLMYDPLRSTSLEISDTTRAGLLYMLKIYPYTGNNYKIAFLPSHLRSSIPQFPIREVLQRAVQKECHLYAVLAVMSARLPMIHGAPGGFSSTDEIRQLATYHIRQELLQCKQSGDYHSFDRQVILDILWLSVFEMHAKNYDAAAEHISMVGQLYHLLDLTKNLDHWISETAAHCDNQLALFTGNLPILPQTFDPGYLLPERMVVLRNEAARLKSRGPKVHLGFKSPSPSSLIVASNPRNMNDALADIASTLDTRMGSRFKFGLRIGIFDGEMISIVQDLVDCIDLAKVVWLSPIAVCYDAEWLCRKARSILRQLLAADREITHKPSREIDQCMESLRLSLVMLLTHACTLVGYQTAKGNVRRLQASMRAVFASWTPLVGFAADCAPPPVYELSAEDIIETGLGLWAMITGAFVAADMPEEKWFLVRAANIARTLKLYTYEDLDGHLSHYLYSKSLQASTLRKVCDRIDDFYRVDSAEVINTRPCPVDVSAILNPITT